MQVRGKVWASESWVFCGRFFCPDIGQKFVPSLRCQNRVVHHCCGPILQIYPLHLQDPVFRHKGHNRTVPVYLQTTCPSESTSLYYISWPAGTAITASKQSPLSEVHARADFQKSAESRVGFFRSGFTVSVLKGAGTRSEMGRTMGGGSPVVKRWGMEIQWQKGIVLLKEQGGTLQEDLQISW